MLRLIDSFLITLGRRSSRARSRLAYQVLFTLAVPERPERR
jgi:hypothetical protein